MASEVQASKDNVNHPDHYNSGGIECIDAMIAAYGKDFMIDFCVCTAFKYLWRHKYKNSSLEDRKKAVWYLNKSIELSENGF